MIEPRIARRYVTALFNAASKAGLIDRVESDLGLVSYTFESLPELFESIVSPVVPNKTKREIVRSIFEGKAEAITLDYLYLLIDKHREEAISQTEEIYILLANEARGMTTADVTTAIELDKTLETALAAKLSAITGKKVSLNLAVDPAIIGGVVVKIGDRVIDGSIKGQLAALREMLLA